VRGVRAPCGSDARQSRQLALLRVLRGRPRGVFPVVIGPPASRYSGFALVRWSEERRPKSARPLGGFSRSAPRGTQSLHRCFHPAAPGPLRSSPQQPAARTGARPARAVHTPCASPPCTQAYTRRPRPGSTVLAARLLGPPPRAAAPRGAPRSKLTNPGCEADLPDTSFPRSARGRSGAEPRGSGPARPTPHGAFLARSRPPRSSTPRLLFGIRYSFPVGKARRNGQSEESLLNSRFKPREDFETEDFLHFHGRSWKEGSFSP
jgi:hypothetical protein